MVDQASRIELEIQGRPDRGELVPLRTFARATESLTDLLAQIAADRPEHVQVNWFVSGLRKGGAILEVEGRAAIAAAANTDDTVSAIMRTTVEALEMLERDGDVRALLSYPAMEKARALANLVNDGAAGIIIRGFGREVPITGTAAERAKELLTRRFHSFGSIEGTVETISVHESKPYFNVFHALDGHAIKCRCDNELLLQVKEALGARVRVVGAIMRRFDGRAETVEVSDFRLLRRRDQLPQVSEIRGILAETDASLPNDGHRSAHG